MWGRVMKVCPKILVVFSSMLFLIGMLAVVVSPVMADEVLIWEGIVLSSGATVTSAMLENGHLYHIVADWNWWYNDTSNNLAADAQYYTTDPSNSWNWGNHFPAPGGHSFLQINGQDVNWGAFSNGDTGHTYAIYYTGEGASITFKIVDWMDDNYDNNDCKLRVRIYKSVTVGGYVVDSNPMETVNLSMVGAMMVAGLITTSIIKYFRKTHRRTG